MFLPIFLFLKKRYNLETYMLRHILGENTNGFAFPAVQHRKGVMGALTTPNGGTKPPYIEGQT